MGWRGRLGRAAGQLALALLNATLIILIVAALSVGFALQALERVADANLERIAEHTLAAADIDPARLDARLTRIGDELEALRTTIAERRLADDALGPSLDQLEDQLAEIAQLLRNLRDIEISIAPSTLEGLEAAASALLSRIAATASAIRGETEPAGSSDPRP